MPNADPTLWSDLLRRTLSAYDEPLLRQVAARLIRPRNQWPVNELIDRCVAAVENPAVLDRRRADLEAEPRRLLALIGHSRQPTWDLGNLIEMLLALGCPDGLQPVFALLQAGLLFPRLPEGAGAIRIKTFEQWLAFPGATGLTVFTPPLIASRAVGEELGLPDLSLARRNPPKTANSHQPPTANHQPRFRRPTAWSGFSAWPFCGSRRRRRRCGGRSRAISSNAISIGWDRIRS